MYKRQVGSCGGNGEEESVLARGEWRTLLSGAWPDLESLVSTGANDKHSFNVLSGLQESHDALRQAVCPTLCAGEPSELRRISGASGITVVVCSPSKQLVRSGEGGAGLLLKSGFSVRVLLIE